MHTPDGFITGWICIVMLIASILALALALKNLRKANAGSIAAVAAVIFLAQMINFPIAGATSGHLVGAAFAFLVLGAEGAVIAMAAVLLVQALAFGDGGLLSLGVNIFTMGIIGVHAASFAAKRFSNSALSTFAASWVSVIAASIAAGILLAMSGIGLNVIPAMAFTHSIIGIGEGLITLVLVNLLLSRLQNPSLGLSLASSGIMFLIVAMILPFASQAPDGLESIAINLGFFENAVEYTAPLSYSLGALAAFAGAGLTFLVCYIITQFSYRAVSSQAV